MSKGKRSCTGCLSTNPAKVFANISDTNGFSFVFSPLFRPFWRYISYFSLILMFPSHRKCWQPKLKNRTLLSKSEFSKFELKYFKCINSKNNSKAYHIIGTVQNYGIIPKMMNLCQQIEFFDFWNWQNSFDWKMIEKYFEQYS